MDIEQKANGNTIYFDTAFFKFNEDGQQLYAIGLYSNYQILDLKQGIRLEDAIKIMGKKKIRELQSEEEGYIYKIEYTNCRNMSES